MSIDRAVEAAEDTLAREVDPAPVAGVMAPPLTPGRRLRATREAMSMTISDVAEVLRFSPRQIELLESDQYEQLPGATLVRGFVRSYAKLLKLDSAPLLAALTPDVPPRTPDVRPPMNMGEAEQMGLMSRTLSRTLSRTVSLTLGQGVPWGSLLAGGVVLFALGLVFYLMQARGMLWTYPWAEPASVPASVAPTVPPVVSTPAPAAAVTPTEPVPAAVSPAPATVDLAPALALTLAPDAVVAESVDEAKPVPMPLVAEFDDLSWIEVRDSQKKIVLIGEYPKGTRQQIEGQPPFQVWIGRASAVRMSYGERRVDLNPHTRANVARLTIE